VVFQRSDTVGLLLKVTPTVRVFEPIVAVVAVFQLAVLRTSFPDLGTTLAGLAAVLVGLALFVRGLELALFPLGEAMAGELLGEAWEEMLASVASPRSEVVARAMRDLLADCLSTLPTLLQRENLPALHFHFATYDAPRRQLFPQALEAYEHFVRTGALERLWHAAHEGKERWLAQARALLALEPAARESALSALLEDNPLSADADPGH